MANGQVNVITIEVEGTLYTQTRPGYYYKKVDGKQTRIPKAEWEQAFDTYTSTQEDEFDAEGEIKARKDAESKKDRETEKNFNKKQTKKARRSKDVAYEMARLNGEEAETIVTLTAKQVDFLKSLPGTSFWEDGIDSILWCDCIAQDIDWNPMSVGAMISTLREKNLIVVARDDSRQGKPKAMTFTDMGKQVAKELGLN
jgi:hypothetical protein